MACAILLHILAYLNLDCVGLDFKFAWVSSTLLLLGLGSFVIWALLAYAVYGEYLAVCTLGGNTAFAIFACTLEIWANFTFTILN